MTWCLLSLLRTIVHACIGSRSVPLLALTLWFHVLRYLALAQSFVAAGQSHVLAQYLSFDASTESLELAGFLVSQGKEHTALMQLGLDMYFRLGAITPLVLTLLDVEEVRRNDCTRRYQWSIDAIVYPCVDGASDCDLLEKLQAQLV